MLAISVIRDPGSVLVLTISGIRDPGSVLVLSISGIRDSGSVENFFVNFQQIVIYNKYTGGNEY